MIFFIMEVHEVNQQLKFRKWFKYGLKAQKLRRQHALKGQKPLAQGTALGNYGSKPFAL